MLNQMLKVELYGASYFKNEGGQEFVSVFVGQPVVNEEEENAKGIVIMKVSAAPEVYHALNTKEYPCPVDMHVRMKKAAGGKLGMHCFKLDIIPPTRQTPSSAPAQNAAKG